MNPDPELLCKEHNCGVDWTLDFNTSRVTSACPHGHTEVSEELNDQEKLIFFVRHHGSGYGTLIPKKGSSMEKEMGV